MKATADLPGAPDANSALAGLGTEQVSANQRHFGDGVGGHEHVDLDAVGSAGNGDAHSNPRAIGCRAFSPRMSIQIATSIETGCCTVI